MNRRLVVIGAHAAELTAILDATPYGFTSRPASRVSDREPDDEQ